MTIRLTILPNGLRVMTDTVTTVDSVAVGVWAAVGTRDEDMKDNGVAHMVEHMMFKGTPTRSALKIAEAVEDVGGQMNAYTGRENTAYYIHLLKEDLSLALNILADIVQNPTMPEEEIERERGVILQEIGMTLDTPDDLVFDYYQEVAYPGQALGAPILGRGEIIRAMTRDTLMDYVRRFYTPGRLVIAAAGNVHHADFVARVQELFDHLPGDLGNKKDIAAYQGGEKRVIKDLEQAHLVMGFRGVGRLNPDYYSAMALSTLLGGGMSSRLFQEVREKRGLVYSIYSFHSAYQDDGQFGIYAGTGAESLTELVPVVCDEIGKVCQHVTPQELARAKAQIRASLLMGQESMMSRADRMAKHLIYHNSVIDMALILQRIDAVTTEGVQQAARSMFASPLTVSALGPVEALPDYAEISRALSA